MSEKTTIPLTAYERGLVQKLKAYVDAHPERELQAEVLAPLFGLSVYKIRTGFLLYTGQRLSQYVKARRMEKAKELLLTTNQLLFAIARQCGYADAGAFSRAFKQYSGLSPDAFRRQ